MIGHAVRTPLATLALMLSAFAGTSSIAAAQARWETIRVWAPAPAAAHLAPVIAAYVAEGGGQIDVLQDDSAKGEADLVMVDTMTARALMTDGWGDPLFATTFAYQQDRKRHSCSVIAADRSPRKGAAGMFLMYLASRASRIEGFLEPMADC